MSMRYDLATAARNQTRKRGRIVVRPIVAPVTFAKELASLNVVVAAKWSAGLPRILSEYERTLSTLTNDSAASTDEELDLLTTLANEVIITLTPRMKLWAERVSKWHLSRWTANVLTATNVDLSTILGPNDFPETIDTVLRRNTSLIRDISETIRGKIADTVFRGFQNRTPLRVVAKEMREAVGIQRKRAIRIASHQAQVLSAELDRERMRQAGMEKYQWRHSGKKHPREEHVARDGQIFPVGKPSDDMPGMAINCGCNTAPVLDLEKI